MRRVSGIRWALVAGLATVTLTGSALVTNASAASTRTTWTPPLALGQVNGSSSMELATAGNTLGSAAVVWTTDGRIYASLRSAAGGWTKAAAVSAVTENAWSPTTAVRPDGSTVLVWAAQRASDTVIESSSRSAGGAWSSPVVVSATGLAATGPVRVGVDGSGVVLAAWGQTTTPPARSVMAASLSPGGAWSKPAVLATPVASSITQISVAVNPSGAAVVGWVRVAGDLYGDVVTRPAGRAFGAPSTIAYGFLRPLQNQIHFFRVAIGPTGRASAGWNTAIAWADAQQASGAWSPATSFASTGRVGAIDLATDTTDIAQLLWSDSGQTKSSSLPPGGGWGGVTPVLPGSSPMDLTVCASGSLDFAGWYDVTMSAITAATHDASGWRPATTVGVLGSTAWIAAVKTAPVGSGAIVAWIAGTTGKGTVSVSVGTP